MSKPMLVTLPFSLLLLDFWPLGGRPLRASDGGRPGTRRGEAPVLRDVGGLDRRHAGGPADGRGGPDAAGLSAPRASGERGGGLHQLSGQDPLATGLAVFYPHSAGSRVSWKPWGAALLLAAITVLAFRFRRPAPFLLVGWLWFLGTLVPVIGLVQVGGQAMADRYTYVPLVGLFLALSWGVGAVAAPRRRTGAPSRDPGNRDRRRPGKPRRRRRYNSGDGRHHPLRPRGCASTPGITSPWGLLCAAAADRGAPAQAIDCYESAIGINPLFLNARYNLGVALMRQGRRREAIDQFRFILERNPRHVGARVNAGVALVKEGRHEAAVPLFTEVLRLEPGNATALLYLGASLEALGRPGEALTVFRQALVAAPESAALINGLIDRLSARRK